MRRRLLFTFLALVGTSMLWMPAEADATLLAQGTTTLTLKALGMATQTCTTTTVVQFHNSGSTFLLTEATPAGQQAATPPVCAPLALGPYFTSTTVRQCTPNGGIVIPGSALTVSGTTYTIKSPYTTCAGKNATDTITMTVSASSVVYKHTLTDGSGSEIQVTGTLARLA